MPDDEWVDLSNAPLIADVRWLDEYRNGKPPETEMEDSWAPRNLAEMEDSPPVQPTLGGLSLCYPGKRHVFSGPQESAKTLAAYVIGLSVVRSGSSVVLIDFEMGPWDAKTRLRELGATDDELGSFLYVDPQEKASAVGVGGLVALEPALVIVDASAGAFDLQELDDNKRADVERFSRFYVTPFWKAGIATIVLDHVTKNVDTRGNYAIGSERKVGGADVHLGFSVVKPIRRGETGLYKVTTHKDRGGCLKRGKLCDFKLESDPETHSISWEFVAPAEVDEDHPWRPWVLMEKVSRYVEMRSDPVPMSAIKENVTGKTKYVVEAVNHLVEDGYMDESVGDRNARLFVSITACREGDISPVPHPFPPVPQTAHSTRSPFPPSREERVGDGSEAGNGSQRSLGEEEDDGIPF